MLNFGTKLKESFTYRCKNKSSSTLPADALYSYGVVLRYWICSGIKAQPPTRSLSNLWSSCVPVRKSIFSFRTCSRISAHRSNILRLLFVDICLRKTSLLVDANLFNVSNTFTVWLPPYEWRTSLSSIGVDVWHVDCSSNGIFLLILYRAPMMMNEDISAKWLKSHWNF